MKQYEQPNSMCFTIKNKRDTEKWQQLFKFIKKQILNGQDVEVYSDDCNNYIVNYDNKDPALAYCVIRWLDVESQYVADVDDEEDR